MAQLQNDLYKVGYFLSRCCDNTNQAGPSLPPVVLAVRSWSRAYDVFYSQLSGGKALLSFRNNLKNVRDLFDGHFDNGRVGWMDPSEENPNGRTPRALKGIAEEVFEKFESLNHEEVWEEVRLLRTSTYLLFHIA